MSRQDIAKRIVELKQMYFRHQGHFQLKEEFDDLLAERQAELELGIVKEAKGIALIGASGSGKSFAIQRLLDRHKEIILPEKDRGVADVISFKVPSPANLKNVAKEILTAFAYPMERDRSAAVMFGLVRNQLKERQVKFLHIDEVTDLYTSRSEKDQQSVINTFKSFMQHPQWPVSLILSGMPALRDMLNDDPQLGRRLTPIFLRKLSLTADEPMLRDMLSAYLKHAELRPTTETVTEDFLSRLLHAGAYEFGMIVEVIIEAIAKALKRGSSVVEPRDFASAMRKRVACFDGMNPFVIPDYRSIDPRMLLPNPED